MELPKKAHDLTGRQFSRLVALEPVEVKRYKGATHVVWLCRCSCGALHKVMAGNLRTHKVKSCGCLIADANIAHSRTHGLTRTAPEYRIWSHVIGRCCNPDDASYANYGGRGIIVSPSWRSFENFYADMGPRPDGKYTLERLRNDGPYSRENCIWATWIEQANNKRSNRHLTINDRTLTIAQWAREAGLKYDTLHMRLMRGWDPHDAINTPLLRDYENPKPRQYRVQKRQAALRRATPSWLTKEQRSIMRKMATQASETGATVDHIAPLQGRLASGLNVPWNLQILSPQANIAKGNRMEPGIT